MVSLEMTVKQNTMLASLLVAAVLFFGILYLTKPDHMMVAGGTESDFATTAEQNPVDTEDNAGISDGNESIEHATDEIALLIVGMLTQIERQTQIDGMLIAELESGVYSFEYPLVVVDPYGVSPLTALVLFTSDEPLNISVHVPGKTERSDVYFTVSGFNTNHQISIYGLYPGILNKVELVATALDGFTQNIRLEIQTDPLPFELAKNIIITNLPQPNNYQPGFNFTFVQKSAFDVNGDYRWFHNDFRTWQSVLYDYDGNMVFTSGDDYEGEMLLFTINTLGKVLNVYFLPYGAHHDVTAIDNGNLLITGSKGDTIEDFIYELDMETGQIVNTLDLKYVLQRTRASKITEHSTIDWFHHNATVYDDGYIIISGRHQSAVAKLSWPDGKLEWILSDHIGWNPMFQKYLLTPIGHDFEWSYGQHAPKILPDFDNNPDTIDILLFDNGNNRFEHNRGLQLAVANNEVLLPENYSRMVHYRINEKTRQIEQIWQFGKELGETYFAYARSDARLLENGNRLGTFNSYMTNFIEVDPMGNIVWEAYATSTDHLGSYTAYRLERLPLYTAAANDLQIGVSARVFIPEDKMP